MIKMNILIINQPLNNRGDESAHKALVRTMVNEIPNAEITVLFEYDANKDSIRQYAVNNPHVHYICHTPIVTKGFRPISQYGLKKKLHFLWYLHPGIRSWMKYFKKTDYVVCAPGGINMGGFQSWYHLFNLYCAKIYNKPIAYYGRSIGPFPVATSNNRRFKEISSELLHYFKFISVRDSKSEQEIKQFGVPYYSVVDTAFLETPHTEIPPEISKMIGDKPYWVYVPNRLVWHYAFKGKTTLEQVTDFFVSILRTVLTRCSNYNVVMLPQTFNGTTRMGNDVNFFIDIKKKINDERVIVVPDQYSSDIQQTIISQSKFVIGARYHSIVFAINNSVPFIALNYEHKIEGLLKRLCYYDTMIDICEVFNDKSVASQVLNRIDSILCQSLVFNTTITSKAKQLANSVFVLFKTVFFA